MTNEQCDNVAEKAWSLAHEPGTNFSASVALKDCVFTIKDLQSRIADLEKDAARYRWLKNEGRCNYFRVEQEKSGWVKTHSANSLDAAIDTAMQKD